MDPGCDVNRFQRIYHLVQGPAQQAMRHIIFRIRRLFTAWPTSILSQAPEAVREKVSEQGRWDIGGIYVAHAEPQGFGFFRFVQPEIFLNYGDRRFPVHMDDVRRPGDCPDKSADCVPVRFQVARRRPDSALHSGKKGACPQKPPEPPCFSLRGIGERKQASLDMAFFKGGKTVLFGRYGKGLVIFAKKKGEPVAQDSFAVLVAGLASLSKAQTLAS